MSDTSDLDNSRDDVGDLATGMAAQGEIVVSVQPEGLLISGDAGDVEAYIDRIRGVTGRVVDTVGIDKTTLGDATGLAAGAAAFLGQSAKFVQLHPESMEAIRNGRLISGTDGFYRMMTRGADGKFVKQLQWKQTNINPARLMSLQMVAVQLALTSAITAVEESVKRVEGKVEEVLRLAHANRSGDALGDRTTIDRMTAYLDRHGSFSDADWDSIAAIGPALNRTVEQLRHHADRTLRSFDPNKPIKGRAEFIVSAVQNGHLGETLSLLVVAQESLFKWQRLRLARVEATQPEHLQQVMDDARDLLARQLREDGALYQRAHEVLTAVAKTDALDGLRIRSVRWLERDLPVLRADLDRFASARRSQVEEWQVFEAPSPKDAASAAIERVGESASVALNTASKGTTIAVEAAGQGIQQLGSFIGRARDNGMALRRRQSAGAEESSPD